MIESRLIILGALSDALARGGTEWGGERILAVDVEDVIDRIFDDKIKIEVSE